MKKCHKTEYIRSHDGRKKGVCEEDEVLLSGGNARL